MFLTQILDSRFRGNDVFYEIITIFTFHFLKLTPMRFRGNDAVEGAEVTVSADRTATFQVNINLAQLKKFPKSCKNFQIYF